MVHHLEQNVEDVLVGFFDFVQQQDGVGIFGHRLRKQSGLVETYIAGRSADESGYGVTLHVFAHVEAGQLHSKLSCQLPRQLRLADAGGAGEKETAHGFFRVAETGAGRFDCRRHLIQGLVLPEEGEFQVGLKVFQYRPVVMGYGSGRNPRHAGDDGFYVLHLYFGGPLLLRHELAGCSSLVENVDGGVGMFTVVDMAARQLGGNPQGVRGVDYLVVILIAVLDPVQYGYGLVQGGLRHVDFLKTPGQGAILFKYAAKLFEGGGADTAQLAVGQEGFEKIGGVHGAAAGGAGADYGVDFVDEEDGVGMFLEGFQNPFEPGLKIAAKFGSRQKGA